jgi:hypothetical protein
VENVENQTAVFPFSHRAWKSPKAPIPTFPQARRRLVVFHQQRTPSTALRALAGAETACPTYIAQVITTVVPTAALLAGFGVTAIGRI